MLVASSLVDEPAPSSASSVWRAVISERRAGSRSAQQRDFTVDVRGSGADITRKSRRRLRAIVGAGKRLVSSDAAGCRSEFRPV